MGPDDIEILLFHFQVEGKMSVHHYQPKVRVSRQMRSTLARVCSINLLPAFGGEPQLSLSPPLSLSLSLSRYHLV